MKKLSLLICSCILMFSLQSSAQVKKPVAAKKSSAVVKSKTVSKTKSPVPAPARVAPKPVPAKPDNSVKVRIITDSGTMVVKLYDSTPLHRDNFVRLVNQHFYDSLLFHRVIRGFMIQGGDPQSKNAVAGMQLGGGGGDMARIPAEFRPTLFHKKGVLAAARDGNPEKASSACQFYIVQGRTFSEEELAGMEMGRQFKFPPAQRLAYKTVGGTPQLDQGYTVFGEVISGLEVIDKIASVATAPGDRPVGDVKMRMELVQ